MKRLVLIALVFTTGFTFLQAQEKQTKPEEKTIVNKEFDEDGNLIKYDSTFVWSWSGDSAFQFGFPMNDFFSGKNLPGVDESILDSVFPFDAEKLFFDEFFSKDFDELLQQLNGMNTEKPDFESKEEEKAWNELMEKQKSEREAMKKRMKEQ